MFSRVDRKWADDEVSLLVNEPCIIPLWMWTGLQLWGLLLSFDCRHCIAKWEKNHAHSCVMLEEAGRAGLEILLVTVRGWVAICEHHMTDLGTTFRTGRSSRQTLSHEIGNAYCDIWIPQTIWEASRTALSLRNHTREIFSLARLWVEDPTLL